MKILLTVDGDPFDLGYTSLVQLIDLIQDIEIHQPLFSRLAEYPGSCVRTAVSSKINLSAKAVEHLLSDSAHPKIQENIALYHLSSPGIRYKALVKWFEDDHLDLLIKLAADIDQLKLSQVEIDNLAKMLLKHPSSSIRRALAKNNRLSSENLKILAQDGDESVANRALRTLAIQHQRNSHLDASEEIQSSFKLTEISSISNLMMSNYHELERYFSSGNQGNDCSRFHWGEGKRVTTSIINLDVMTGGMRPREITMLAGGHNSKITTLALNITANAVLVSDRSGNSGNRVAIFSCLHSEEELSMRMLSSTADVNLELIQHGNISVDAWRKLARASNNLAEAKLHVMQDSDISIYEIYAVCKRLLKKQKTLDLVVIDQLNLMNPYSDAEQREMEFDEISRVLRMLADKLNVPVLFTVALPSEIACRPLVKLRSWSESLFDSVDTLMILETKKEKAFLQMRKHIAYPTTSVTLRYDQNRMKFDPA